MISSVSVCWRWASFRMSVRQLESLAFITRTSSSSEATSTFFSISFKMQTFVWLVTETVPTVEVNILTMFCSSAYWRR